MKICLTEGCQGVALVRGCCNSCYRTLRKKIQSKQLMEEDLIREGKMYAPISKQERDKRCLKDIFPRVGK